MRIAAGAFGASLPARDLYLSPDHAVYVDGVLIPVKHLINGTTIEQVPVSAITYFHVELPRHDVLLAECLPVESYLDIGDRSAFGNGGAAATLHPDFASRIWEAEGCAPLVVAGPTLAEVRQRLRERAFVSCIVGSSTMSLRVPYRPAADPPWMKPACCRRTPALSVIPARAGTQGQLGQSRERRGTGARGSRAGTGLFAGLPCRDSMADLALGPRFRGNDGSRGCSSAARRFHSG